MRLWERKRVGTVIRRMYELFKPKGLTKYGKMGWGRKRILAREGINQTPGSAPTKALARYYLGVESKRIAGVQCWLPPTRSLEEALKRAQRQSHSSVYRLAEPQQERFERYVKDVISIILDIFEHYHGKAPVAQLKQEFRANAQRGYSGGIWAEAKKRLEIKTVSLDGQWFWVYPDPGLMKWMETRLITPLSQEILLREAQEYGWMTQTVFMFKREKGFSQFEQDGKIYWYNINTWSKSESRVPAPKEIPTTQLIQSKSVILREIKRLEREVEISSGREKEIAKVQLYVLEHQCTEHEISNFHDEWSDELKEFAIKTARWLIGREKQKPTKISMLEDVDEWQIAAKMTQQALERSKNK